MVIESAALFNKKHFCNNVFILLCLDVIQEIRTAHKLMEQTLQSKLNSIGDSRNEIIVSKLRLISNIFFNVKS